MADLDKIDNDILNELMSDPKTVTPPEEITETVKPLVLDEVDKDIFKEQVANNPPPMLVQSVEAGKTKDPDAFAEAKRRTF